MVDNKKFSVEEAERLISWLEAKFDEITPVREKLVKVQEQLLICLRQSRGNGESSRDVDLNAKYQAIDRLRYQIQKLLKSFSDRGVIVRDIQRGLVDFPFVRDGRLVNLCWVRGEKKIEYWHETNVGFSSRKHLEKLD